MAFPNREYFFYPGRKAKRGVTGPEILVVDGIHKFRVNRVYKDKTVYKMFCNQYLNPEFFFFLASCDDEHNHLVDEALVKAEEYKIRMDERVMKDPALPVGDAIKAIKLEIANELSDNEDLFMEVMDSLGSHHALELRLLRVRDKVIGSMPKNRESFDPINFLTNVFENNDVIVLDSNTEEGVEEVMIRKKL